MRSPAADGDGQRERLAARDLPRRLGVDQAEVRLLRPAVAARTGRKSRRRAIALSSGRGRHEERARPATDPEAQPSARSAGRRSTTSRKSIESRLLHRLPDRRLAEGRRAEPVVVGRDAEELDGAGQPVVQARASAARSAGRCRGRGTGRQGRDDVTIRRASRPGRSGPAAGPGGRPRPGGSASRPGRPRSRAAPGAATTRLSPWRARSRRTRARSWTIRDSNRLGCMAASRPVLDRGTDRPAGPHPSRPGSTADQMKSYHLLAFPQHPFRRDHARNSARTGQVFQSGIGGSVSSGTFCGLGRSLSRLAVVGGRVELAPRRPSRPGSARARSSGRVRTRRPAASTRKVVVGIGPSRTGGGRSRTSYSPSAACGRAPSKTFARRATPSSASLRGPCPLRSTWTATSPPVGARPGLGNRTRIWTGWLRW